MRRCVSWTPHAVLLLMVIEANHGKVARFLDNEIAKTESQKSANA